MLAATFRMRLRRNGGGVLAAELRSQVANWAIMRRKIVGCLYPILSGGIACSGASTSPVCTQELRPALMVWVKDSLTNTGTASGASLIVREGTYKDSVAFPNARPDLNDLNLNAAHVNTVQLTALLQPAG